MSGGGPSKTGGTEGLPSFEPTGRAAFEHRAAAAPARNLTDDHAALIGGSCREQFEVAEQMEDLRVGALGALDQTLLIENGAELPVLVGLAEPLGRHNLALT